MLGTRLASKCDIRRSVGLDDLAATSVGGEQNKDGGLAILYTFLRVKVLRLCSFTGARIWKRSAFQSGLAMGISFLSPATYVHVRAWPSRNFFCISTEIAIGPDFSQ